MYWLQAPVRESVLGSILCKDTWNPAPLSSYEAAGILLDLFDKRWKTSRDTGSSPTRMRIILFDSIAA
jgi:hypothetical protein